MRLIMRRDRSSKCVMSARDAGGHHSSQLKLRKLRCNSSDLPRLRKEDVVRNNVKRVALSRSKASKNASNHSSSLAGNRNKSSVGPVRLRLKDLRGR